MPFACPACGAPLVFEGEHEALACGQCGYTGHSAEEPRLTPAAERMSTEALERGATSWGAERLTLSCGSCGADLSLDPAEIATRCPFCASPQVRPEKQAGGLRPNGLGTFRVDMEEARGRARAWLAGGWMFPAALKEVGLERFTGLYLPYWSFSASARAPWTAEVGHEQVEGTGRSTRRTLEWSARRGVVDAQWTHLLIPATRLLPPTLLARIEPFDPDDVRPYSPEQLVGWQAHGFDVPLATAWGRANERMRDLCENKARARLASVHVRNFQLRMFLAEEKWTYVLLPVWVSAFVWEGRAWQVLVNGHTGVVDGHRPVVWLRVYAAMIGCLLPAFFALPVVPIAFTFLVLGGAAAVWILRRARRAQGPDPAPDAVR